MTSNESRIASGVLEWLSQKDREEPDWVYDRQAWKFIWTNLNLFLKDEYVEFELKRMTQEYLASKIGGPEDETLPGIEIKRSADKTVPSRSATSAADSTELRALLTKVGEKIPNFDYEKIKQERRCRMAFELYKQENLEIEKLYLVLLNKNDTSTINNKIFPELELVIIFIMARNQGEYRNWARVSEAWNDFVKKVQLLKSAFLEQKKAKDKMGDGGINLNAIRSKLEERLLKR